jgi:hypothetical protein
MSATQVLHSANVSDNFEMKNETISRITLNNMGENIRCTDTDDNLSLFSYINCSVNDTDQLKRCRGIVYEGTNLISDCCRYTYEFTENEKENIEQIVNDENIKNCYVVDSFEGTLIRAFYYKSKWYMTTHRKLNMYKTKWSSKRYFGEYFEDALYNELRKNNKIEEMSLKLNKDVSLSLKQELVNDFQEAFLDKNKQYMFFLMANDDTRLVCNSPNTNEPHIYHVGTYYDNKIHIDNNDIGLSKPKNYNFNNMKELYNFISKININKTQGLMIYTPEPNCNFCKILNNEYYFWNKIRDNVPSVKFRYLQLRNDKYKLNMLKNLYPNYLGDFETYENILFTISQKILQAYFDRFINKKYTVVSKEEYNVIKMCHSWHMEDRDHNKISIQKVSEMLDKQPPVLLNKMIKAYLYNPTTAEAAENKQGTVTRT